MNALTEQEQAAIRAEAELILSNPVINKFLRDMALEATANDIRNKTGSGITSKYVDLHSMRRLSHNGELIRGRINEYMAAGILAVAQMKYAV